MLDESWALVALCVDMSSTGQDLNIDAIQRFPHFYFSSYILIMYQNKTKKSFLFCFHATLFSWNELYKDITEESEMVKAHDRASGQV